MMVDDIRQIRREVRGISKGGFPKELELPWRERFDRRISIIFLFTFILMFGSATLVAMRTWQAAAAAPFVDGAVSGPTVFFDRNILPKLPAMGFVETIPTPAQAAARVAAHHLAPDVAIAAAPAGRPRRSAPHGANAAANRLQHLQNEVAQDGILASAAAMADNGASPYHAVYSNLANRSTNFDEININLAGNRPSTAATGRMARGGIADGRRGQHGDITIAKNEVKRGGFSTGRRGEVRLEIAHPQIQTGEGKRNADQITAAINKQRTSVEYCHQRSLRVNPNIRGRIDVEVQIAAGGQVLSARVIASSLTNPRLEQCIIQSVRKWRFAKVDQGKVTIRVPFVL